MLESSANCGGFVEYGDEVQIVDRSCWISILFVFLLNKFRSSISIQRQASFFQITYQQGQNINILRMEDYASPVTLVSKCQSSVSFIVSEPVLEVSYRQTKNIWTSQWQSELLQLK